MHDIKTCNRCGTEKTIADFYLYTNGTLKSICKRCENTSFSKCKLWYCEDCGINIRQMKRTRHLKSKRHLHCYFTENKYNSENLQKQNKRITHTEIGAPTF
jgi:hypothetical protein